jgi:hypothetical protein
MVKTFLIELGISLARQVAKRGTQAVGVTGAIATVKLYSDSDVTAAVTLMKALDSCDPIISDLNPRSIEKICQGLRSKKEAMTRALIEQAQNADSRKVCISILKLSVTIICNGGPTILREATFNLLGC